MGILIGFLYVIEVAVCLLLGLVVMLQKPKEGGLGGAIAGGMGEAVFGAEAGTVLIKATIWLGTIFLVNTLALARFTSTVHTKTLMSEESVSAPVEQQMPEMPQMPAAPAAPAAPAPAAPAAPAPAPSPAPAPAAPAPAPAPAPAAPAATAPAAPAPAK